VTATHPALVAVPCRRRRAAVKAASVAATPAIHRQPQLPIATRMAQVMAADVAEGEVDEPGTLCATVAPGAVDARVAVAQGCGASGGGGSHGRGDPPTSFRKNPETPAKQRLPRGPLFLSHR
jgi:hypothetical protein